MVSAERVPVGELAARRRPRVVLFAWALEALVAWLLAGSWSELVGAVYGQHPDGDRALWWGRGLVDAADFVVRQRPALQALLASTAWGLALWFLAAIAVLGGVLSALSSKPLPFAQHVARAVGLYGRLAALQLVSLVMVLACLGGLLVFPIALFASGEVSPLRESIVVVVAVLATSIGLLVGGAVVDLARAIVVRWDAHAGRAFLLAMRAPHLVGRLATLSAPRVIAALGLIGFGAAASSSLRSVFAIAVAHQLCGLGRVALRTSVLARALRLADDAYVGEPELDAALSPGTPRTSRASAGATAPGAKAS
jgi:hypothetical protein